jgi:hypothetical protein
MEYTIGLIQKPNVDKILKKFIDVGLTKDTYVKQELLNIALDEILKRKNIG